MKLNTSLFFLLLIISKCVFATAELDVYGVDDQTAKKIIEQCAEDLQNYHEIEIEYMQSSSIKQFFLFSKLKALHKKAYKKIQTFGDFKMITFGTTSYADQRRYMTVNLVLASDAYRMPKSPQRTVDNSLKLNKEEEQIFQLFSKNKDRIFYLLFNGKINIEERSCPAPHCAWGFTKEELVHLFPKLRDFANQNSSQLKRIIECSGDEQQRGDAIFILGYSDFYKETAQFLLNYIHDESSVVRNNAMRVIGEIASKYRVDNLSLNAILTALNFPYDTDRNKASFILYNMLSREVRIHQQIIKNSGDTLVKLLKLKQPNNHDMAYKILKKISHKNYAERDYESWERWIKNHR